MDSAVSPRYLLFSESLTVWSGYLVEIASGMILRMAEDASVQHVGDGAVVLLARSGQLYTCNGTTEAFLEKIDGERSLDQIVGMLSHEFEIDKGTLDQDMAALAGELVSEGILAAPGT
jgi:pyrroloquinoline quinone biosynthesis protein D